MWKSSSLKTKQFFLDVWYQMKIKDPSSSFEDCIIKSLSLDLIRFLSLFLGVGSITAYFLFALYNYSSRRRISSPKYYWSIRLKWTKKTPIGYFTCPEVDDPRFCSCICPPVRLPSSPLDPFPVVTFTFWFSVCSHLSFTPSLSLFSLASPVLRSWF